MYKHLIFSLFLLLQGCTAALVGGAGTAGYYAGKDERDVGTIMSDAGITAAINAKLISAKGVNTFDINIDTFNGVVIAKGIVASKKIKEKILSICKNTSGVKKVISKLKIDN